MLKTKVVTQTPRHYTGTRMEWQGKKRERWSKRDKKKEESMQAFLRTVFVESGCLRFISHYSWVLSQA